MDTNIYEESAQRAWDAILSKVRELEASGMKRAEISRLLGHSGRSAVTNWLKESSTSLNASFPDMLRYIDVLGLDIRDYLPGSRKGSGSEGESAVIRRVTPHAPNEVVQGDSLPQIPVMGGTGAGDDVELFQATPSYWISVLPQYMVHKDIFGLVVYGDSMEPTIHKGAVVGVIPFDGSFNEGGIYLVQRPPFGRTIKRVKLQGGQLVLISDNAAYEPDPLPFEGYEKIILGRVVWVWQLM
ncbi:MAG: helix-turn-helix transcriptional regulator [Desulfovibrio piger]|uniref:S24 family peptidase n=1 Tax=Desulfovibrio piger TaxID=901 RepID=UPI0039999F98